MPEDQGADPAAFFASSAIPAGSKHEWRSQTV